MGVCRISRSVSDSSTSPSIQVSTPTVSPSLETEFSTPTVSPSLETETSTPVEAKLPTMNTFIYTTIITKQNIKRPASIITNRVYLRAWN